MLDLHSWLVLHICGDMLFQVGLHWSMRNEIQSLTGIRALAAAWVVLHHYFEYLVALFPFLDVLSPLAKGGFVGVELFFVLSGFILTYTYAEQFQTFNWQTYRTFLIARIARLYPVHLACLLALVLIVTAARAVGLHLQTGGFYGLDGFIYSLLMIQAWGDANWPTWNFVAWSISAEWFAYLTFPLSAVLFWRVRAAWEALAVAGVILPLTIYLHTHRGFEEIGRFDHINLLRIVGAFLSGVMMYWLYSRNVTRSWRWPIIVPLLGLLIVAGIYALDASRSNLFWAVLPMPLLILGLAYQDRGLLASRGFLYWGRVSYALYMTHLIVKAVVGKVLPPERFDVLPERILALGVYLGSVALTAMLMYHLIEEPGRKAIRHWTKPRMKPWREERLS